LFNELKTRVATSQNNSDIADPIYRDFRAGDVKHSLADISKAKNNMGYDPQFRIDEGLDVAMNWYVDFAKKS
jgi:UDP-N-acetylglucosamine 4-epimerase